MSVGGDAPAHGRSRVLVDLVGVLVVCAVIVACGLLVTPVRVDGSSMSPTLRPGDLALVRKGARPRTGDVVMFRLEGDARPTIHRVRSVTGGGLVTRGDANPIDDRRCVPRGRVLGTVRWIVPLSRPSRWLRERLRR